MIKIDNISKKFIIKNNTIHALKGIDLLIEEGDCFAIVGESGSGKTTLANIILGIYKQDEGRLWFNEQEIKKYRSLKERKLIQFVQQNPTSTLNPKKTIRDTLALPLKIHNIVKKPDLDNRIKELLSYVGLDSEFMIRYPDTLSGGQKQRVAIARALASEPKVLILDEPTSALDVIVQAKVLNLLLDIKKKFNLTYVFITHDLSVVRNIANKLIVMNRGEIEENGETKEVFNNPKSQYTKELINAIPTVLESEDRLKPKLSSL
jgi:ABC-type oligopeptide transport system ATPase subunit|tara:strand:- start:1213 stop:2001 length:789 start_codon:yes stop_codon:yes gene_type:complete